MLQRNAGITLVALMVTIIVLLILAMVSVSLVLRGNIIEKANLAVTKYDAASEQENTDLDEFEGEIDKYVPKEDNTKDIIEMLLQYGSALYDEKNDEKAQKIKSELLREGLNLDEAIKVNDEKYDYYIYFHDKKLLLSDEGDSLRAVDFTQEQAILLDDLYEIACALDERLDAGRPDNWPADDKVYIVLRDESIQVEPMQQAEQLFTVYKGWELRNWNFRDPESYFRGI